MKLSKYTVVPRYSFVHDGIDDSWFTTTLDGDYVETKYYTIAIQALRKIANEDYRGNRPQSAVDAHNVLMELGEFNEQK